MGFAVDNFVFGIAAAIVSSTALTAVLIPDLDRFCDAYDSGDYSKARDTMDSILMRHDELLKHHVNHKRSDGDKKRIR